MLDLNAMRVFAKVVDEGGFSAAGRALGLPKSNISRRIAALEGRLGLRLLERTTRKLRITEPGQVFYRHCKRIEEEAEHASLSLEQMLERPRGLLRIGASVTTGQVLLAPLMAEFLARYPDVTLDLVLSNRRIDLFEEGFDLVIRIGQLTDSSLISKRLGESRLYLYASPDYLAARGQPLRPEDLAGHDVLIMSDVPDAGQLRLKAADSSRRIVVSPRVRLNDFPALSRMVLDGAGIAALPDYLCGGLEEDGGLTRVLADWSLPPVDIHALYPSHRGATPKLRAFLDFLGERIGQRLHQV